jgi:hypothetical protein
MNAECRMQSGELRKGDTPSNFSTLHSAFCIQVFFEGLYAFNRFLAMTTRWISLVPSPIVQSFTSR